jgi:UDP:flavonoid glycosyltransferase YjiC (YdhE family)
MASPPPHVVVTEFVPHARGFPHVATIVSQGGHGTVMKALAHGIPLVCLPLCGDRPEVAARVVIHKEGSLAMAAPQPIAHQQRSHEVFEKKQSMACTTG